MEHTYKGRMVRTYEEGGMSPSRPPEWFGLVIQQGRAVYVSRAFSAQSVATADAHAWIDKTSGSVHGAARS